MVKEVGGDAESGPDELGVLLLCHFAENLRDAAEDVVVPLGNKFPEIEQREFHLLVVNLAVSVVLAKAARFLEHLFVEDTEPGKVNVVLHTYNFLHQKVIAIGGHKSTCQKKPEINTKIRRAIVEVYSPTDSQFRQPGHTSRAHRQSA